MINSGERAWEWGMGWLVECISPQVDGKKGSHITLGFCSTFGQANSSGASSVISLELYKIDSQLFKNVCIYKYVNFFRLFS